MEAEGRRYASVVQLSVVLMAKWTTDADAFVAGTTKSGRAAHPKDKV